MSRAIGTIRGLHFQVAPDAQGKLIRVTRGELVNVGLDLRRSSPTFGAHYLERLSADGGEQIWLPAGFAHGFCTLAADTVVAYKVTAPYAPESERTLAWDDPALGVEWPPEADPATLSAKDADASSLADLDAAGDLFP